MTLLYHLLIPTFLVHSYFTRRAELTDGDARAGRI